MAALPWAWICLCFFLLKRGSSFPLSPSACSHRVVWLLGFSLFTLKYKAHLHDCFCDLTLVHFSFIYISCWDCTHPALYQVATSGAEKLNQPTQRPAFPLTSTRGSSSESSQVKMSNVTAETNMFIPWYKILSGHHVYVVISSLSQAFQFWSLEFTHHSLVCLLESDLHFLTSLNDFLVVVRVHCLGLLVFCTFSSCYVHLVFESYGSYLLRCLGPSGFLFPPPLPRLACCQSFSLIVLSCVSASLSSLCVKL